MRLRDRKYGDDLAPMVGAAAAAADDQSLGAGFWPSVGVGVTTGLIVWMIQHLLLDRFTRRAK